MKTKITRRILMAFAVSAFFVGGAFAQTPIPGFTATVATDTNYIGNDFQAGTAVTLGRTIPLYARPDKYYHPSYSGIDGSGITGGHSWTWSTTAGTGTVTTGAASDNYVEITGATLGAASVEVFETGPTCADGSPETIAINIIATPTVSIAPGADITACEGDGVLDFATTAIEATIAANGADNNRLLWSFEIYTMTSAVADEWFDVDLSTSLGATADSALNYIANSPNNIGAAGTYDITSIGGGNTAFMAINNKSTVYTYTITGINDDVSRRSDFLDIDDAVQGTGNAVNSASPDKFRYWDVAGVFPMATTDAIVITVHPVPVTGPIFHINNTWAN